MVVPIWASLIVTWKPRTATLLDQSSKPYASPSWMETPGRLSTTEVTLVIFDCCRTIGSATTLLAKIRGSSATTLTDSSCHARRMTMSTVASAPAARDTRIPSIRNRGRVPRTR